MQIYQPRFQVALSSPLLCLWGCPTYSEVPSWASLLPPNGLILPLWQAIIDSTFFRKIFVQLHFQNDGIKPDAKRFHSGVFLSAMVTYMFCLYLFVWLYPLSWVIVLSRLALPLQKRWNYCQVEENEALRRQNVLKMFWYQELRTALLLSTSPTSPPTHTQIPPLPLKASL